MHKGMVTTGLQLHSIKANHLEIGEHVLTASLDLSAAFNIVNVGLLLRRLENLGLPLEVLRLIKIWITNRSYYVNINGKNLWG